VSINLQSTNVIAEGRPEFGQMAQDEQALEVVAATGKWLWGRGDEVQEGLLDAGGQALEG